MLSGLTEAPKIKTCLLIRESQVGLQPPIYVFFHRSSCPWAPYEARGLSRCRPQPPPSACGAGADTGCPRAMVSGLGSHGESELLPGQAGCDLEEVALWNRPPDPSIINAKLQSNFPRMPHLSSLRRSHAVISPSSESHYNQRCLRVARKCTPSGPLIL